MSQQNVNTAAHKSTETNFLTTNSVVYRHEQEGQIKIGQMVGTDRLNSCSK